MLILDENVIEAQRQLFLRRRFHVRQIGIELGWKSMGDDDVLRLLRTLRHPVLITGDQRLFHRDSCHARYTIVIIDGRRDEVFPLTVRLLRHREFENASQRVGRVVRASNDVVRVLRVGDARQRTIEWE